VATSHLQATVHVLGMLIALSRGGGIVRHLFIELVQPPAFNAGKKAFDDVNAVLGGSGYTAVRFNLDQPKLRRLLLSPLALARLAAVLLNRGHVVVVQAPLPREIRGMATFLLRIKRARVALLLHDIDSMRYEGRSGEALAEVRFIDSADAIICHTPAMKRWLRQRGARKPISSLNFFDYLVGSGVASVPSPTRQSHEDWRRAVVFAGALSRNKSGFLFNLPDDYGLSIQVFGSEPSPGTPFPVCIRYSGRFPPDAPTLPLGLFGLIWDGPQINTCTGSGEYMRINSPHKASLYLSCGLPVICWRQSGIAPQIESQQLGIAVDSLEEIPGRLATLPMPEYTAMLERVAVISRSLRSGGQLKAALRELQTAL
jgi:hypothetical protein